MSILNKVVLFTRAAAASRHGIIHAQSTCQEKCLFFGYRIHRTGPDQAGFNFDLVDEAGREFYAELPEAH